VNGTDDFKLKFTAYLTGIDWKFCFAFPIADAYFVLWTGFVFI